MSDNNEMRKIVADVAAAYFSNSHVASTDIPTVISQIATSLMAIGAPAAFPATETGVEESPQPRLTPSQIRKSVTRDAIISFEDGKAYKTLRRHLTARGMTPEQYRDKWGLPKDYAMVAPAYSEARASLARSIGLGARGAASRSQRAVQSAAATHAPESKETAPAASTEKRPTRGRRNAPTSRRRLKKSEAANG